jgi:hypothetical protein
MPWHYYVPELVSGLLLSNGVPHFVQGVTAIGFSRPLPPRPGSANPHRSVTPSGDLQIWRSDSSFSGSSGLKVLKRRLGGSW